jgi:succinate dehydrogenase / fumarate reductase cytochrome b subunit
MNRFRKTFTSSVGMKWVMALTGFGLLGFVCAHLAGNLLVLKGPDAINAYAKGLKDLGPGLWVLRLGLLGIFALHVGSALRLVLLNKRARPVGYVNMAPQETTYAARTMWVSGLILLGFVLFHLAHLTLGFTPPEHYALHDAEGRHDVYSMVVLGFQQWPVVAVYVVAQLLLGTHISHGVSSAFHTLGLTHPSLAFLKNGFGKLVAAVIVLGNVAIPTLILAGVIGLPAGGN